MKKIKTGLFCVSVINSTIFASNTCAIAQIIPNNTLGLSSITVPSSEFPLDLIGGRAVRGANLFHSFSEFMLAKGGELTFIVLVQVSIIFWIALRVVIHQQFW